VVQGQSKEKTYNVHWYGPLDCEKLGDVEPTEFENCVLYLLCGTHGLYGRNVPLYIGKTERDIQTRIKEHSEWIDYEPDPVQVYWAAIAEMKSFSQLPDEYPAPNSAVVSDIENLLIYAHQPVYNRQNKVTLVNAPMIRILNTGRRSTLFPEISTLMYSDEQSSLDFVVG